MAFFKGIKWLLKATGKVVEGNHNRTIKEKDNVIINWLTVE